MMNFVKLRWLLLVPLFFMLPGCGLMTSVNALDPPISQGASAINSEYTFIIENAAYNDAGQDFVFSGIELYYKIFIGLPQSGIENLMFSSQLIGYGFKRLYKFGETTEDNKKPVLDITNYKTTPDYIKFVCKFDNTEGTLTVTYYNNTGAPIVGESFELKRSVFFPVGSTTGPEKYYKGFNEFEESDTKTGGDISDTIWTGYISLEPQPLDVKLMLYAFSYGFSLDPNHIMSTIESQLAYLGQLDVTCRPYEEP